ncbi:BtpA/SgcQ family protein [Paeniglutamicibacter sp. NPDC091659]|uniref:BtpA/SgcQ family protein n=1 Tax=Paeniglutamicibacter sp. NPDC091659 TaxID=3364389 RepID=UPI00380549AF
MTIGDSRFSRTFSQPKPILGMLHLSGDSASERLDIAREELEILRSQGVDGVVVENYFGDKTDVRNVLEWLEGKHPDLLVGVNVLHDHLLAFELARQFRVDFIQMDSVAGHLAPEADEEFALELQELRGEVDSVLFGGVRFKYQPVNSGRTEAEDLVIGMDRCDAFVITSDATGQETDLDKVKRFRSVVGETFPLLIGAGLTASNVHEQLEATDGAIVGSFLKDTHVDTGRIAAAHVELLMREVRALRTLAGTANGQAVR